ncbi:FtsK/SpoIIIE domain-containing protein [Streptomyces bobili]|uniref:FtsK/SpoIIIE domain-containing protein n=1 Tax=Streptomyces bobili TaxID=67280 RepID=UPI0022528328|nr:FtsK/SpoIIIE domain-containing protein [Streptomyces bobili]MCX5522606.1 FtsK/SpoIIIE domain-containing protein [Streptomyces bobili]
MSIETTPSGAPDPEWEGLVADFVSSPDTTPVVKEAAPADLMGDAPLVPVWTKTPDGWKNRAWLVRLNSVRSFRKWLRRQGTRHGQPAQVYRGAARITVWVRGVEGAEVSKAKHEARRAHKEYRQAQWANGKRLMPGSVKDKLSRQMGAAAEESERAMNKYRKARKDARTLQTLRAAAAVTPIVAVEGAGLYAGGGPGGLLAAGLTLAGLALIGRRTNTGELWSDRDAKIGDGDRMTETMLNRVYQDAKVISSDDVLKMITPCTLTADGKAWQVVFNLPSGIPAKKALGARDGIANGFGVSAQQIHQVRGDREDRIHLRVSLKLPFSTKPAKGPLLEMERVNLWRPIWMGVNLRGEEVLTSWVERSGLFGGEPGSGKSAAANDLLLAAALDPTVRMYLADGKAGADITPFEPIATMFDTDGEPERLLEILEHIWTVEIPERRALAKEHGSRKLTEAMAAVDPRVCLAALLVDEWSSYGAAADRKTREEMERLLRLIVQQGRALGIITLAATQKPDSDSVPTGIRDILSIRWAMRCLTPQASDTILGQGYASAGHSAQDILKSQRGVGIYMDGEGAEPELVRGHYYDDDEVALLLDRAYALRKEAGTLPVGPIDQLRGVDSDGVILADLVALYADGPGLLPAARVLEGLTAAGHTVTADRLAVLVPRTDEERKRQEIDGSKVSVYPLAAVRRAVADRYKIAV